MSTLNLKHLYYFHIFTQELSTTKAAQRLKITSPALSNQLKDLEKSLELKLIDRINGKFEITEHGRLIHSYTHRIFTPYEELKAHLNVFLPNVQLGAEAKTEKKIEKRK